MAALGGSRHALINLSTQIDIPPIIKKSLSPATGYFGHKDEQSHHLNTFYVSFASVCALQMGAFCILQNFFQRNFCFRPAFEKVVCIITRKGEVLPPFDRKEVRTWNLIAENFKSNAVLVDLRQRLHDGGHEFDAAVKVHGAVLLQFFQEGLALDEVHDDVGRFVLDENGFYPHDAGNPPKLCHFPGFLQETVEAFLSAGFSHHGAAPHHGGVSLPADHTGAHGIVFLDGDLLLQQQVKADVGDAEAALPQHFAHQILSVQDRTGLQRERLRVHAAVSAPAFRTVGDPSRQVVHTFHTSAYFHSPFLFLSGELVGFPPFFGTITVK